jgi:hypothetical protein
MGGPQSLSGQYGEVKILCSELLLLSHPAYTDRATAAMNNINNNNNNNNNNNSKKKIKKNCIQCI